MKKLNSVVIVVLLILSLGGCASKKSDEKMMDVSNASNGFYDDTATESAEMEMKMDQEMEPEMPMEAKMADKQETGNGESIDPMSQQKLIRTVTMGIETEYFDDTVTELDDLCKRLNGYVGNSDLYNVTDQRSYSIEMRIPQENLDEFLDYVSAMGRMKINSKKENTQDITLDYFDAADHKKSLEIERDRILELIEKADTLKYVVELEDKLSELRYQISSYESQLRHMDSKVSYSTVNLDIREVKQITVEKDATAGERIVSGLKRNLNNIKDAFINFMVWFISSLPNLILFGIVVFIAIKIGRKEYKKYKNKNENKSDK